MEDGIFGYIKNAVRGLGDQMGELNIQAMIDVYRVQLEVHMFVSKFGLDNDEVLMEHDLPLGTPQAKDTFSKALSWQFSYKMKGLNGKAMDIIRGAYLQSANKLKDDEGLSFVNLHTIEHAAQYFAGIYAHSQNK